MKIHLRIDEEVLNSKRRFACGIGPELPTGDQWTEFPHNVTCDSCGITKLGTPLSQVTGQQLDRMAAEW